MGRCVFAQAELLDTQAIVRLVRGALTLSDVVLPNVALPLLEALGVDRVEGDPSL